MSCDVPFGDRMARQSRPLIPSVKHHGDKSTALKGDMQGRRRIFFADWQSAEDEEAKAYCGRLRGADVQIVFERNINAHRKGKQQIRQGETTNTAKGSNKYCKGMIQMLQRDDTRERRADARRTQQREGDSYTILIQSLYYPDTILILSLHYPNTIHIVSL